MSEQVHLQSPPPASPARGGCLKGVLMLVLLGLLGLGTAAWFFLGALREAGAWLRELPGRLVGQDISTTFRESITRITATHGDVLEVATLETDETVTRFDMKTAFNELVYLGTTVSEIRTPVVYRYHIKISENWQVQVDSGRCIVRAPALRPSSPPAVRTDGMQKKSEAGWLRFNAAENLASLERELTPTLEKRAGNKAHLDRIREAARGSVAEFVKRWLLSSSHQEGVQSITVIFPDDHQPATGPVTLPPTLQLQ
jgi:hypothetical protein